MCRLFSAFSTETLPASYFLYKAPQSLLYQSCVQKKRLQEDGWGVGWFQNGRPRIRKSPRPIFKDQALLRRVARQARGGTLVGHVRWASNPLKLSKSELIGLAHTQPFVYQKWVFAHNGTLLIPREVKAALGPWEKWIQGKNDSEVLFFWLLKHLQKILDEPADVVAAMDLANGVGKSLAALDEIWKHCRKQYPIHRYPYHGLNCVLTDKERLIAFSLVDPDGWGKSKALCNSKQPYYQLQRHVTPESVIVASEPLNPKWTWEGFAHRELLLATRSDRGISVSRAMIDL